METLPPELTLHILGFLPAKEACHMKRLSRSFKEIMEENPNRIQRVKMELKITRALGKDWMPRNALFVKVNEHHMELHYNNGEIAIQNETGSRLFLQLTEYDDYSTPMEPFLSNLLEKAEVARLTLESNWLEKLASIPILQKVISVSKVIEVTGSFMEFGYLALKQQNNEKPTLLINEAKFLSMLLSMVPGILGKLYKEVQIVVKGSPESYLVPLLKRCIEKVELPLRVKLTVAGGSSPPSTAQANAPQLGLVAFEKLQSISDLPDLFTVVTSDGTKMTQVTIDRQPETTVINLESKLFH